MSPWNARERACALTRRSNPRFFDAIGSPRARIRDWRGFLAQSARRRPSAPPNARVPCPPDPDPPCGLNQKQTVEPPRLVQTSNLGKTRPECIFLIFSDPAPPRAPFPPPASQVLTKPADGKAKDGKVEEIPIPEIRKVATYEQDYRPNFSKPVTYLRSRTFGAPLGDVVEYDLDNDDEDWLEKYNDGQNRLPAEKLEVMISKLEVACGEANDAQMAITAAAATERGQIISYQDKCAAMAGTDALPKEKALELLQEVSGRPAILEAVYVYWCEKRKRTGKPCLRRLQPPPAPNDANPFNVFRQREKTNRPQTRRRRENDAASFDKMRQIRRNVEVAYAIVELQLRREEKKLERARCECDAQALQIKLRHEPRTVHEEIEAEYAKKPSARALSPKELEWDPSRTVTLPMSQVEVVMRPDGSYGLGGERFAPPPGPGAAPGGKHGSKKRRREEQMAMQMAAKGYGDPRDRSMSMGFGGMGGFGPGSGGLAGLPSLGLDRLPSRPPAPVEPPPPYQPPPEIPDIEMIFAATPDLARLRDFVLPLGMHKQRCRPRIARGGRVVFDRKDPITRQPYFDPDGGVEGLPMDVDEHDENEQTPIASIRV